MDLSYHLGAVGYRRFSGALIGATAGVMAEKLEAIAYGSIQMGVWCGSVSATTKNENQGA